MSTNRRTRSWPLKAQFTPEVLQLFVELEHTPRGSRKFKDGSRRLAHLLGLTSEWWTCQHVNDTSVEPCHPEGYIAFDDWHRVRAIRIQLLEAARGRHDDNLSGFPEKSRRA